MVKKVPEPGNPEKDDTEKSGENAKIETLVSEPKIKDTEGPKTAAKAGKRSAKAVSQVEEKEAKEIRKAAKASGDSTDGSKTSKLHQKPARPRLERHGKKYIASAKLIEKNKYYSLTKAADLALKTSTTSFDASVELHVNLNVDPRHADQNIRGHLVLPAGTGKKVRVAVLADGDEAKAAANAGADIAALEDLLNDIEKNALNFDVLISTPANMPKLGKHARILGPRGLMPNPKSGTVTTDIVKAVTEAKAGRVEFRVDSAGIVHLAVGKVSFGPEKLVQNLRSVLAYIKVNKPSSVKGSFVRSIHISTSMGPSIAVDVSEIQ